MRPLKVMILVGLSMALNQLMVINVSAESPVDESLAGLKEYLKAEFGERSELAKQAFASKPLTRDQAAAAQQLLWQDHEARIRRTRADEMKQGRIRLGNREMPFFYKVFGKKPANGRSLYISMHGGGGTPKRVNDQQWENQKRLYTLTEGVYLVPRAPTNTWNLWHQGHIDSMFDRLIENLIVFEDVDPNRVYIMGYSAGGDGVYQLAPRMADRLAGAAMMAGHPNETSPLGLRNIAFTMHVGGNDGSYNRNGVARSWKKKLAELQKKDPNGYVHWAKIYEGKGHWLDREDAAAIPWLHKHDRKTFPKRIVWKQDDVTHARFYWLAVDEKNKVARSEIIAKQTGQAFEITAPNTIQRVTLRLNDEMVDLEKPITISAAGHQRFRGKTARTIKTIAATLAERGDPQAVYSAQVTVELGEPTE